MKGTTVLARQVAALVTGLLFVLAFPSPDLGWLAWIALIPLLLAIEGQTPAASFRLGYLAGLIAFGGTLTWMRIFSAAAWLLVTAIAAVYVGAFAAGVRVLARRQPHALLWAAPLTWVAIEVIRSVGPIGFPWVLLGLSQYRTPHVLPLAGIVGVFGVSGLIVLVNAIAAHTIAGRRLTLATGAAVLVALIALAAANARRVEISGRDRIVAALQPNVPPTGRVDPATAGMAISGLLQLTTDARQAGAELIVYPESAVPADLAAAADVRGAIAHSAAGAVVVAGSLMSGPRNGLVVLDPKGEVIGRYAKRQLVPFGEAGIIPGRDPAMAATPVGRIGLAICYESAHPYMIRSAAKDAEFIALLTNDGWFGRSSGPAQHAAHAVMRAVETGKSLIRAANTGTSMLIRPDGTVVGSLPIGSRGVLAAALPAGGPPTPYMRWGWLVGPLAVAAWLAAAAPLALDVFRRHWNHATRLAIAILIPGVVWMLGRLTAPDEGQRHGLLILLMLITVVALGRGHLFNVRGVWISAVLSLALTALLISVMRIAYAQYGFQMPINTPAGGWAVGSGLIVAGGIALEAWLRGAVFGAAAQIGGWVLGTVVSTVLGILIHWGLPQEIVYWHLVTGLGFSLLRAWTRDALGLGIARGLGDAAVLSLAGLR
ncbi:MAG: apolipoprotein N-acyltransferase [Armatimonadota bacterium]